MVIRQLVSLVFNFHAWIKRQKYQPLKQPLCMLSHVSWKMSVLPYLKRCSGDVVLPDPEGELSRRIPSNAISSVNRHVANNHHNPTYV